MTAMDRKPETFVATGRDCQKAFNTLVEAMDAAKHAPWSDGRVFMHKCELRDFSGDGEMCGELVWEFNN